MLPVTDTQRFVFGVLADVAAFYVCVKGGELNTNIDKKLTAKSTWPLCDTELPQSITKYERNALGLPSDYFSSFSYDIEWPSQSVVAFFDVVPDEQQNINEQNDNVNSGELQSELTNDDEIDDIFSAIDEEVTTDYNPSMLNTGDLSSAVLSLKANTTGEFDWDYWHFGNDDTPNMLPLDGWKNNDKKGLPQFSANAVNGFDEDSLALANIVDDDELIINEDWWGQLPNEIIDSPPESCSNGYKSDGPGGDSRLSPSTKSNDSDRDGSEAWNQIKKHIADDDLLLHSINSLASHQSSQGFLPFIPPNGADISPVSRNGFSWDQSGHDEVSSFNANQTDLFHELGLDVLDANGNNGQASLHLANDGPIDVNSSKTDNLYLHRGIHGSSYNATGNPYGEFFDLMGLDNQSPTNELQDDLAFRPIKASRNVVASTASESFIPPHAAGSSQSVNDSVYALFTDSRPYECNPQTMGATIDMASFFGYNNDVVRLQNTMADVRQVNSQGQRVDEIAASGTVVYGETQREFAELFGVPTHGIVTLPVPERELVDMPVNEFLVMIERLPGDVAALARDIRRRGKNKFAARNCRKRKIDDIDNLKDEVEELQIMKERLLDEVKILEEESESYRKKSEAMYKKIEKCVKIKEGNIRP